MSAILTTKTMLFLAFASFLSDKYHKTKSAFRKRIYLLLAIGIFILNSLVYDASNRATMVMCALASLTVVISLFGYRVRKFLPIILVVGVVLVWRLFSFGTLGVMSAASLLERQGYIAILSNVVDLYSNGISTLAHSYNMYEFIESRMTVSTFISELIKSNNIFTLPGFWVVGNWIRDVPSIQNLFNETLVAGKAYILPNAGLAMYLSTPAVGILIDMVFHFLIVYSVFTFHRLKEISNSISYKYLYSYCEMICAFMIMNNIMIAIGLLTDLPFLLWIFISVNDLGHRIKLKWVSSIAKAPLSTKYGGAA